MSKELITREEFATIQGLAKTFITSGLFKDTQSEAAAIVKMLAGRELQMGPFESMRNLNVIQGQATLTAGCVAARIKGSGKYDYRIIKNEDDGCELEFYQDGKNVGVSKFNKADATAAGLLNKDIWKKYPRNMYFARALTNGARWYCAEVFGGPIYTPEELSKANAIEVESVEVTEKPRKNLNNGGIHKTVDPETVDKFAAIERQERLAEEWNGKPDDNPHLYVIEGREINGAKADIVGKAVMELSHKQLVNAMKPKNFDYTTERDRANIAAILAEVERDAEKSKPAPVKVEQGTFNSGQFDDDIPV